MRRVGEIVRHRAETQPDRPAYTVVSGDEQTGTVLTYASVDRSARAVAVALDQHAAVGERVLLALPQGVGYLTALFGCILAGTTAVPCYPPRSRRRSRQLEVLAVDAGAKVVITDRASRERVDSDLVGVEHLSDLRTLVVDEIGDDLADDYRADPRGTETALLQYTSGSTAAPKGVMLGHDNLMANALAVQEGFGWVPETRMVMWCPLFHDMGLFGGAVGPMIIGCHSVLLRPEDFIMQPLRWLQAITRHRGTISGGPNFGYEHCVVRITPDQLDGIDLSTWTCAFNGAEPVRVGTLERFSAMFAKCGFRADAFFPCYGMAEATTFISGGRSGPTHEVTAFSAVELSKGQAVAVAADHPDARALVGCGRLSSGHEAFAVDVVSRQRLPENQVGEIWFSGPSVAHGYWRHPVASEETYAGRLATGEGPYLRTGDLGFLRNGQIYIVGRIKDILIIRGRNFSPSDIELTIRGSHPELRRSDGVVFSVEMDGEERLVVAWEVRVRPATFDPKPAIEAIRTAIANEHGVDVHAVALLRPGGVPRTASGKVQRGACRVRFMAQRLDLLASWRAPVEHGADPRQPAGTVRTRRDRAALEVEIETWLVNELASNLGVDSREVDVNRALADFGLDSVQGTRIAADLSILLGRQLPATLVWDHPTIAQLAKHLAEPREVSP